MKANRTQHPGQESAASADQRQWPFHRLRFICALNPRRPKLTRKADTPTTFIPMSAVEEAGKGIQRPETRKFAEVCRGYTCFAEGDVLFAKITPCMQNAKHAVATSLRDGIGFGSTEFHVLRPGPELVSDWLHLFLIQPTVLGEAEDHLTGTVGQQRLPEDYLGDLQIPLPKPDEQRRITTALKSQMAEVAAARAAIQNQVDVAKKMPAALLRRTFDPNPNRQGAPTAKRKLGDLLRLRQDIVHPRNRPRGKAVFVGMEHIEPHTGQRLGSLDVEMAHLTGRKARFLKNDIVYGYLRPYLNKVWIADFDGLCSVDQYVYTVDNTQADTEFVAWFMRSPVYLERAPIQTTPGQLPRIRTEEVASVAIDLPSLPEQKRLSANINQEFSAALEIVTALESRLTALDALPTALLRQVFGEPAPAGG